VTAESALVGPIRIAEGLDIVIISDNEVLVQFGSRSHPSRLFRDTELTGVLGRIFARLKQGPATRDELLIEESSTAADATALLDSLTSQGILSRAGADPVEQYLGYTFTGQTSLAGFTVGQIGAGPVGAQIAETLLQHGIGRLRLLDQRESDAVWSRFVKTAGEAEPLRQAGIGLRKRLTDLGYNGVEFDDSNADDASLDASLAAISAESDLVILSLERPDVRLAHRVNRHCLIAGTPWIMACLDGNLGIAGPLFIPGVTACFNDYRTLADAGTPSPLMARVYRRYVSQRDTGSFFPGLPAYAAVIGGYISVAAVHQLLSGTSFLLGRTLTLNFDYMTLDAEDVLRLPRCPVCRQERSAYQPPFSADIVTRGRERLHDA
jgi:hypothetical protein